MCWKLNAAAYTSSAMEAIKYLLFSGDGLRDISPSEALLYLTYSASFSRHNLRHSVSIDRSRETMTLFQGTLFISGIPVYVVLSITVFPIEARLLLMVISQELYMDAGTPAAAACSTAPPNPHAHRASGTYKDTGPDDYKNHPPTLYMSKRGRYFAPPLLPCRVKQPLA